MKDIDAIRTLLRDCDYEPIGDYAIIGDCRSAALVSRTGSIDWLCLPHFSAPSLFAALLDRKKGGRFLVRPRDVEKIERRYVGDSAVLETVFHCASGIGRLIDFMPLPVETDSPHRLIRLIECTDGRLTVQVAYQPRPNYAQDSPKISQSDATRWAHRQDRAEVVLESDRPLSLVTEDKLVAGLWELRAGERARLVLNYCKVGHKPDSDREQNCSLHGTLVRWQEWRSQWSYQGPWPEAVLRSCLTLKLLAYWHSGAVMAAVTTSLPESMEAGRNWDYRFCWLRDTSLLLQSFVDLGFEEESAAFFMWLLKVGRRPRLQPLYDLDGHPVPQERILPHLEGYRGRGPVRIGNAAHQQLQLDIYGEVIQTAYHFVCRGGKLNESEKRLLTSLGESVCQLWRRPDQSIWETRGPPRHYTYSKLMCWVALDRLLVMHPTLSLKLDEHKLRTERDAIRREIDTRGFDLELNSYVGYFGGKEPDASLLLMLRYGYVPHEDRRMASTYRYVAEKLAVDGFLYRYPPGEAYDGVGGKENLFAVCSFWAVDFIARTGEIDAAVRLFERLLALANDVGLYAEQFDTSTRQALGNFPQAFTHSGLVTAALAIAEAMKGGTSVQVSN